MNIYGKYIKLSVFQDNDITNEYIGWLNDDEIVKYSNQRFLEHTKKTSKIYLESFHSSDNLFFSIKTLEDNISIGTITIYINKNHKTADIGILIGKKSCWGKGMGLDAWNTCITWLFDKKNIRKITAGTLDLNLGMISIMKKSGMQQEAVRSKQEYCNGDNRDILYFSKFND